MAKLSTLVASLAILAIAMSPASAGTLTLPVPAKNTHVVMDQCVCSCPSSSNTALQNPAADNQQVQVASNVRRKRQADDYDGPYRSSRKAAERDTRAISAIVIQMLGGLLQQQMSKGSSGSDSESDSDSRSGGNFDYSSHNYL